MCTPAALHGTVLDTPHALSRVTLLRDDGRSVNLADSNGKLRLIFFGYTRCPDVCLATLEVLARAWDTLSAEQQQKLEVQLISVDPDFDCPAVLRRHLNSFNNAFRALTGTQADIKVAEKSLIRVCGRSRAGQDNSR